MVRASASAQLTIIKQVIIFLLIRWILQVMTINLVICPAFGDLDHEKSKNQKSLIDIPLICRTLLTCPVKHISISISCNHLLDSL